MLEKIKRCCSKLKNVVALAVGALVAGVASNAQAILPAEATTAFGTVTTMITDYFAAAWPIVALMVVSMIGIGLFKKLANKAV